MLRLYIKYINVVKIKVKNETWWGKGARKPEKLMK